MPAISRIKDKIENPGLEQQEQTTNRKHAPFYARILLSLLLSFPALDHLGLLQFAVFSLWLILKCGNTSLSLLGRVFHLWIPLPVLSFVLSAIARPLLVSVIL
jgi:hypothetical protein